MKAIQEIEIKGKVYQWVNRMFNDDGTQTDVYTYVSKKEVKHAYLTCKIPKNFKEVYTPSLDDDCLERMINGEVV